MQPTGSLGNLLANRILSGAPSLRPISPEATSTKHLIKSWGSHCFRRNLTSHYSVVIPSTPSQFYRVIKIHNTQSALCGFDPSTAHSLVKLLISRRWRIDPNIESINTAAIIGIRSLTAWSDFFFYPLNSACSPLNCVKICFVFWWGGWQKYSSNIHFKNNVRMFLCRLSHLFYL